MSTGTPVKEKPPVDTDDLGAEFAELGRKFSATINAAWTSEERHKIQTEIEAGLIRMRDEMNKAYHNVSTSEPAQKVTAEVKRVREDVESGKVTDDLRKGVVSGLRTLGDALDRLSDKFTPHEERAKK